MSQKATLNLVHYCWNFSRSVFAFSGTECLHSNEVWTGVHLHSHTVLVFRKETPFMVFNGLGLCFRVASFKKQVRPYYTSVPDSKTQVCQRWIEKIVWEVVTKAYQRILAHCRMQVWFLRESAPKWFVNTKNYNWFDPDSKEFTVLGPVWVGL